MISGNMVGSYSQIGKTFILVDESGAEITGVVTENVKAFNATAADVKIGKTFVSDEGVLEGTDTKTYRTTQGVQAVAVGKAVSIPLSYYKQYDYTEFQCVITKFNSNLANSTAAIKISLNSNVYNTGSADVISSVSKNSETESIDLNIVNDTDHIIIVHYMTYKEEV